MTERIILVIDIGTSSLKAGVMTGRGELLSSTRQRVMQPSETAAQFETARWVEALRATIPHLVAGYTLDALVISGNGPTVVAVDVNGEPVGPPILWLDGERVEPLDGVSSFYLPRIAWFARHQHEAERVRWYLPFPEFLIYWMTGVPVAITPSDDFSRVIWTREDAQRSGIPFGQLPPFVGVGEQIAPVRDERADILGLPSGLPVIAGGSDFLMSLLGTNTVRPGATCDRAGTSEGINHCSRIAVDEPSLRTLPHVIPGLFNVAGILSSTGLLFEWFREISGQRSRDYGEMMMEILRVRDTARIPWFFPSVHRGAAWEFQRGMFIGLGADHGRAEMGRAVVLSIGFAVRESVEILRSAGCDVTALNACGGQAKNGLWTQMKSDITGVPIRVPAVSDAELTGNLCAGLYGLGDAGSLVDASDAVVHFVHSYEPSAARTRVYTEQYDQYRDRYVRFRVALEACQV